MKSVFVFGLGVLFLTGSCSDGNEEFTPHDGGESQIIDQHIQSVEFISRYPENKAVMVRQEGQDNGIVKFDFKVSPPSLLSELELSWQNRVSLEISRNSDGKYQTASMLILSFETDPAKGQITLTASWENLEDDFYAGKQPAYATLHISDGASYIVSEKIPVQASHAGDSPQQPGIHFAKGVSLNSGWYDVNKKRDGRTGTDATLCWAAVCSNMLEWWQDQYVAAGNPLPAKALRGKGEKYELAIFEAFQSDWYHPSGGEMDWGIPWYFTGENRGESYSTGAKPKPGTGGYFSGVWNELAPLMGTDYIKEINGYYIWDSGSGPSVDPLAKLTELVTEAFKDGMAALSIQVGISMLHALTLWGYELDESGLLKTVYVTDSDDLIDTPNAPRVQLLNSYSVQSNNKHEVGIVSDHDGFNAITAIYPFKGYAK